MVYVYVQCVLHTTFILDTTQPQSSCVYNSIVPSSCSKMRSENPVAMTMGTIYGFGCWCMYGYLGQSLQATYNLYYSDGELKGLCGMYQRIILVPRPDYAEWVSLARYVTCLDPLKLMVLTLTTACTSVFLV